MISKTHYFFMLAPSPWPLLVSVCSFNFLFSSLMFLKKSILMSFSLSMISISLISLFWWNTYSGEFNLEGKNSFSLESGLKLSMILFISSEVFFFFSFFWAYFHYLLAPMLETGMSWPPVDIEMFDFSNVPLINTLVLMSSGVTVTLSHFSLIKYDLKNCMLSLLLTFGLGGLFTFLQWAEYKNSFFSLSDGSFGTSFFVLTGFHGIHVLIGSWFLFSVYVRSSYLSGAAKNFLSFELASWYWHFVDVVWIFLYFFLYYLNY